MALATKLGIAEEVQHKVIIGNAHLDTLTNRYLFASFALAPKKLAEVQEAIALAVERVVM
jgi:hypothetical protein